MASYPFRAFQYQCSNHTPPQPSSLRRHSPNGKKRLRCSRQDLISVTYDIVSWDGQPRDSQAQGRVTEVIAEQRYPSCGPELNKHERERPGYQCGGRTDDDDDGLEGNKEPMMNNEGSLLYRRT